MPLITLVTLVVYYTAVGYRVVKQYSHKKEMYVGGQARRVPVA